MPKANETRYDSAFPFGREGRHGLRRQPQGWQPDGACASRTRFAQVRRTWALRSASRAHKARTGVRRPPRRNQQVCTHESPGRRQREDARRKALLFLSCQGRPRLDAAGFFQPSIRIRAGRRAGTGSGFAFACHCPIDGLAGIPPSTHPFGARRIRSARHRRARVSCASRCISGSRRAAPHRHKTD